jgi:hypothetical protein
MRNLSPDSKLRKTPPLLALLLLTTCATGSSEAGCPSLREYSPDEKNKLYIALTDLDWENPLRGAMDDYDGLRRQVKACRGLHD